MKHLHYEKKGDIGVLAVHRPEMLNALNQEVLTEILHFLTLAAPHEKLKVLIVTGSGEKAFIAGADIKEMAELGASQMQEFATLGQGVTRALEKGGFLTIAAVNGYALGGGLEMALACDFIYAAEEAKFGLPEVTLGIIPGFGGTQRLLRAVGPRRAKELILRGKILTAAEAQHLGIVNQIFPRAVLVEESKKSAEALLKNSFYALMQAKSAIDLGQDLPLELGLELEKNLCALCFTSPDREVKMAKFVAKSNKKK